MIDGFKRKNALTFDNILPCNDLSNLVHTSWPIIHNVKKKKRFLHDKLIMFN